MCNWRQGAAIICLPSCLPTALTEVLKASLPAITVQVAPQMRHLPAMVHSSVNCIDDARNFDAPETLERPLRWVTRRQWCLAGSAHSPGDLT